MAVCVEKSKTLAGQLPVVGRHITITNIQKMEQAGEMGEIGREARHGGVLQSGRDTGEHKDKTVVDSEEDEQFLVQVHVHICPCLQD